MATDAKGIFISYRRDQAAGHAGRLADRLSEHFGEHTIFRDIDSIDPGLDFVEAIQRALDSSEVLIVVIGRNWSTATDAAGRKRLQDPHDYVRLEVAAALERNIRVIPVLVQGASMPSTEELPNDLIPLTRRNAFELHESSWRDDIRRLVTALEKVVGHSGEVRGRQEKVVGRREAEGEPRTASRFDALKTNKWSRRLLKTALVLAVLLVIYFVIATIVINNFSNEAQMTIQKNATSGSWAFAAVHLRASRRPGS
jgi:hypothetical protein